MNPEFYEVRGTNATALTFEHELRLARKWRKKKDIAARDHLIKNYLLFAIKITRRYYPTLREEEIHTIANSAILSAINSYDPDREKVGRISNLLTFHVRTEYTKLIRGNQTVKLPIRATFEQGRFVPMSAPDNGNDGDNAGGAGADPLKGHEVEPTIEDLFRDFRQLGDDLDRAQLHEVIRAAIQELRPSHKEIIEKVFFEGKSLTQIAEEQVPPKTRQAASMQCQRALSILRTKMQENPIFKEHAE